MILAWNSEVVALTSCFLFERNNPFCLSCSFSDILVLEAFLMHCLQEVHTLLKKKHGQMPEVNE